MKIHWLKRLLEKVPPGVSISLPGVSIDPGSLAQYFADEDDTHKDAILAEINKVIKDVDGSFKDLKGELEKRGIDTQEKFDELLKVMLQIYDSGKLLGEVTPEPNYDSYLKHIIDELNEWQNRYAPMFAKFKDLTLFARVTRQESKYDPQELIGLIRRNDKLVIIGPAGSGKTTTLKKVAFDNASNFLKNKTDSRIPIIVPLRDYGAENIRSIIESVIKPWELTLEIIEQDLLEGKFIIIFDGLNEVPSTIRQKCFQEIRTFTREYRESGCLFTSRNFEYEDSWVSIDENTVPVCEIESLTQGQIESYIRKYFESKEDLAGKLIYELRLHDSRVWENSKSLARLAGTPLLLQMLILTFEEMGRIPKTEGELLLRFVDEILFKRERSKAAADFEPDVKKFLLASIAWEMQQDELSSIEKRRIYPLFLKKLDDLKRDGRANVSYDASQLWRELQNNHLIVEDRELVFWPHALYQELFVGLSLRDSCFDEGWKPIFKEIYVQFHSLDARKLGSRDFEIGLRMLDVVPHLHRLNCLIAIAAVNPLLAKEAFIRYEPEHNLGMTEDLSVTLRKSVLSDSWTGDSHRNILIAASYISVKDFCSIFNDAVTLCPNWEGRDQAVNLMWYQCRYSLELSVLELLKTASSTDPSPHVRKTALNILILSDDTHTEEIFPFLIQRLFDESQGFLSDPQLHLRKLLDLELVVNRLTDMAKKEKSPEKIKRIIWCLGESQVKNAVAQKTLIEFAGKSIDDEIRSMSAIALAEYPSDKTIKVLGGLVKNDMAKAVRISAINSLHSIGGTKALSSIISVLNDGDTDVSEKAVATLVNFSKKEKRVVRILLRNLKQSEIKSKVLLSLSQISIKETDPLVQEKICKEIRFYRNERDKYVRLEIALALRSYDVALSNEMMRELSNDKDQNIREIAGLYMNEWGIEL
jgi:HEAT repeat protein